MTLTNRQKLRFSFAMLLATASLEFQDVLAHETSHQT